MSIIKENLKKISKLMLNIAIIIIFVLMIGVFGSDQTVWSILESISGSVILIVTGTLMVISFCFRVLIESVHFIFFLPIVMMGHLIYLFNAYSKVKYSSYEKKVIDRYGVDKYTDAKIIMGMSSLALNIASVLFGMVLFCVIFYDGVLKNFIDLYNYFNSRENSFIVQSILYSFTSAINYLKEILTGVESKGGMIDYQVSTIDYVGAAGILAVAIAIMILMMCRQRSKNIVRLKKYFEEE